jgi:hypothetical protein
MKADYSVHRHILEKLARKWADKWTCQIVAAENRSKELKLIEKAAKNRSAMIAEIETSDEDNAYYISECDRLLNLDHFIKKAM